MKRPAFVGVLISLSLAPVFDFGISSLQPAVSQVIRCSDTSLGEEKREEVRGDDSRSELRVSIGQDCSDANFYEYLNEQRRRDAESSKRFACEAFGIDSPRCTDPELRRQAQQEQEQERQRQLESARIQEKRQLESDRIQQEAQRENSLRRNVAIARSEVRSIQEKIIFWSEKPDFRQMSEKKLPLAEADLQRAEKELQDYLNQRNGR